ncbi:hypothetical protein KGF54_000928 [Candida jiufengensis]|uniref:uncharacterized protein n=1 Tax=Candida jiufengensis TaxID=497108 RepID=UPI002224E4A5|nr:uncharacterized protein KGF54_000928 [Candida jiufengensis]KAI5956453.1 hypothetical protein KGF54_000928 [Candida jiufengensis]
MSKLPRATLAEKIKVLDFFHSSHSSQLKTVDRFRNEISISTSSLSEWIKNEEDLRTRFSQDDFKMSKNSKRKATFKYEKINKAMDRLVQSRLEKGEVINEPILREHWSIYAHQYGVDDPKRLHSFSHGWLSQFKKRHGLKRPKKDSEGVEFSDVDPELKEVAPIQLPPQPISLPVQQQQEQPQLQSLGQAPIQPPRQTQPQIQTQPPPPTQIQVQPPSARSQPPVQQPSSVITDVEVERFIFVNADKFFHQHQFDFPKSFVHFQKLKETFFDEKFAARNGSQ